MSIQLLLALGGAFHALPRVGMPSVELPTARRTCVPALKKVEEPTEESKKTDGNAGEWLAAGIITGISGVAKATGTVKEDDERSDIDIIAEGTGKNLAVAAATGASLKVAAGVATKVAATTATVFVAGPAFKVATIGASIVQIGVEKYRADKKARAVKMSNETRIEKVSVLEEAKAEMTRVQALHDAAADYAAATDKCVALLPPGKADKRRLASFSFAGAALGATLPTIWTSRIATAAVGSVVVSRVLRYFHAQAHQALDTLEESLLETSETLTIALCEANEAEAELCAIIDRPLWEDLGGAKVTIK